MGDGDYMHAFQQVVMPIAREFNPDLVIGKITLSHCLEMRLTSHSCRGIRRCRRRHTGWLFCDPRLLCSNDAHAHEPCQRQDRSVPGGMPSSHGQIAFQLTSRGN